MNNEITVALLQMAAAGNDQQKNLEIADSWCRKAAEAGADIALFPEMFNIGYLGFTGKTKEAWQEQAVGMESGWVQHFAHLAKELDMAIGCTYLERREGMYPSNSITLFDRKGADRFTYRKMHTCDFADFEASCTPGDEVYTTELDTKKGTVRVGAMICYDREFPETARMLMLKGAEIVLTPNACPLDDMRHHQFQTRAFENAMTMCMTNYPNEILAGRSVAYDYDGKHLMTAGKGEELALVHIDITGSRFYRKHTIWGNSYRRPHRYSLLSSMHVEPVFERTNGFGEPFRREDR